MKLKAIVLNILLSSIASSLLIGCVGEQNSATPNNAKNSNIDSNLKTSLGFQLSKIGESNVVGVTNGNANKDNHLWTNITKNDWSIRKSRTHYVISNSSGYNITLVGCETSGNGHFDQELMNFKNSPTEETSIYWQNKGLDPTIRKPNENAFTDIYGDDIMGSGHGRAGCYYAIYIPSVDKNMYVKMSHEWYVADTEVALFHRLDGVEKAQSDAVKEFNSVMGATTGTTSALLGDFGFYKYFLKTKGALEANRLYGMELDWKLQFMASNDIKDFEKIRYHIYNRIPPDGREAEIARQLNLYNKKNRLLSFNNIEDFKTALTLDGRIKFTNDGHGKEFFVGSGEKSVLLSEKPGFANIEKDLSYAQQLAKKGLSNTDSDAALKLAGYGKYAEELDHITKSVTIQEIEEVGQRMNLRVSKLGLGAVAVASFAFDWFVIQPFLNKYIFDYGDRQGSFATGVDHMFWDVPTKDEVDSWNKDHPDNKIEFNTNIINLHASPIWQQDTFSFKTDQTMDTQTSVTIVTSLLSSPFKRMVKDSDPYIDLNKKNYFGDNKDDAVVSLSIQSNELDINRDSKYALMKEILASEGVPSLSAPLLSAPTYTLQSLSNVKNDYKLYQGGLTNNNLIRSSLNNINVGGVSGLILNSGQKANLNVAIPSGNLSSNGQKIIGEGFSVTYTSLDEETDNMLYLTKSDEDNDLLKNESNSTVVLAKFKCAYPNEVGKSCPLELSMGSGNDGKHHKGKLMIADPVSETQYIPVRLNYNIVSDVENTDLQTGDNLTFSIANTSSKAYSAIKLSDIPGMKIINNTCTGTLSSYAQCSVTVNFDTQGNYKLKIYGQTDSNSKSTPLTSIPEADTFDIGVNISGGW